MVTVGNVNWQRILVLQGKCTENGLMPSFAVAYYLFPYNGGMLCMNLYNYQALKAFLIPVYENAVIYVKYVSLSSEKLQQDSGCFEVMYYGTMHTLREDHAYVRRDLNQC